MDPAGQGLEIQYRGLPLVGPRDAPSRFPRRRLLLHSRPPVTGPAETAEDPHQLGLAQRLGQEVLTAEAAGFDGDAVEAEAWAYLGARSLKGLALTFPGTTGVAGALSGGVIARARG